MCKNKFLKVKILNVLLFYKMKVKTKEDYIKQLEKETNCLEYALKFWYLHRDYKIYYNSDHCINLKDGTIPPEGYLEIEEFGRNHIYNSFRRLMYDNDIRVLLGLYFKTILE